MKLIGLSEFLLESENRTAAPDKETWVEWNKLVNMTKNELEKFMDSDEGKEAGLSRKEGDKLDINTGRESAAMLLKMIPSGQSFAAAEKNWTPSMWYWCRRQVSFISRMSKNKGKLKDEKGELTRKATSLLIWGHDPFK